MRAAGAITLALLVACSPAPAAASPAPTAIPATATPSPATASAPAATADPTASPAASPAGPPWSTRAQLPAANSEIAVAELAGRIYVIGGYPASRVVVTTVQVYDIARDSWSLTVPLPVPLHHTVAAAANGKLYVFGGEQGATAETSRFVDAVYEYDPASPGWRQKAAMPTARSGGAAAVIGGLVYVAGGRPPRGADLAAYDPAADRWTRLPDLPTQRNHLAVAAVDGRLFVIGGRLGGGVGSEMTAVVEIFDPRAGTWTRGTALPAPRAGVNGIAALGCIFVFGGEGNDADPRGVFAELDALDPARGAWTRLEPIPTPVHGVTGAAFANGVIHLVGGGIARGGSSGTTLHQVYRPARGCA